MQQNSDTIEHLDQVNILIRVDYHRLAEKLVIIPQRVQITDSKHAQTG